MALSSIFARLEKPVVGREGKRVLLFVYPERCTISVHKSESTPTLISKGGGFRLVHWDCTRTLQMSESTFRPTYAGRWIQILQGHCTRGSAYER